MKVSLLYDKPCRSASWLPFGFSAETFEQRGVELGEGFSLCVGEQCQGTQRLKQAADRLSEGETATGIQYTSRPSLICRLLWSTAECRRTVMVICLAALRWL